MRLKTTLICELSIFRTSNSSSFWVFDLNHHAKKAGRPANGGTIGTATTAVRGVTTGATAAGMIVAEIVATAATTGRTVNLPAPVIALRWAN